MSDDTALARLLAADVPLAALVDQLTASGRKPYVPVLPAVLNRQQATERLGIGLTLLNELTASGEIPSLRVNRRRLYRVVDLDSWLQKKADENRLKG